LNLRGCFEKGLLKRMSKNKELAKRTMELAISDLGEAEASYAMESYVWATVQAYTSMLNFARAVLFLEGIREKSHFCTVEYLRRNYINHYGDLIEKLDVLRRERHLTLYDSREHVTAEKVKERIDWCKEFHEKTKGLIETGK
jgi:uncharacterized protein (UPF0332 family)